MDQNQNQTQPEKYLGKMHDGSLGAHRVRESFNPSKDSMVDKIKRHTADLIDLCEGMKTKDSELNRLCALAQTHYEDAAMWAVKAATTPKE
jgi:hypothetical protein